MYNIIYKRIGKGRTFIRNRKKEAHRVLKGDNEISAIVSFVVVPRAHLQYTSNDRKFNCNNCSNSYYYYCEGESLVYIDGQYIVVRDNDI